MIRHITFCTLSLVVTAACATDYDIIIRGGTVYDVNGGDGIVTDVGIVDDTIATIGDLTQASARTDIDASGLALAPGFINILSWLSDIRQGVTLEVFG